MINKTAVAFQQHGFTLSSSIHTQHMHNVIDQQGSKAVEHVEQHSRVTAQLLCSATWQVHIVLAEYVGIVTLTLPGHHLQV